jgi:hypothetical protein
MNRWDRKKENNKKIWMSILIAALMIFSVFGVILGSQTNELKYGKFKFTPANNYYLTKIDGKEIAFYTLPPESSSINMSSAITNKIKEAYFVVLLFDPSSGADNLPLIEVARFDLSQSVAGKSFFSALTNESADYAALPVMSCANATLQTPILFFNISNTPGIVDVDNCIYINARGNDIIRLRDRILYSYYGIIKDE